jgi:hypothetical protein
VPPVPAAAPAAAQETAVSAGLQAGANISDQAGDDVFAPWDNYGFLGGALLRIDTGPRFGLQVELLYVTKGGRENTEKRPGDISDQLKLTYLEIPLLLKFRLATSGGVRPEIFAGAALSFELSCTYDDFPEGVSAERDCTEAGIDTRSVDLGGVFGIALDVPAGSGSVVIDARGEVGLRSLDDSAADLDYYNRFLSLMVGYRFPL